MDNKIVTLNAVKEVYKAIHGTVTLTQGSAKNTLSIEVPKEPKFIMVYHNDNTSYKSALIYDSLQSSKPLTVRQYNSVYSWDYNSISYSDTTLTVTLNGFDNGNVSYTVLY